MEMVRYLPGLLSSEDPEVPRPKCATLAQGAWWSPQFLSGRLREHQLLCRWPPHRAAHDVAAGFPQPCVSFMT